MSNFLRFLREPIACALMVALVAVALLAMISPSSAGNTTFFTSPNGDATFPFSPPNRATGAPGTIDNMIVNPAPGTPTIASGACGTGTNGAVVAGSTNQSGQVAIGASAATACVVTFAAGTSFSPKSCTISPMNAGAADSATAGGFVKAPTSTGFEIDGLALASTNWSYQCF